MRFPPEGQHEQHDRFLVARAAAATGSTSAPPRANPGRHRTPSHPACPIPIQYCSKKTPQNCEFVILLDSALISSVLRSTH